MEYCDLIRLQGAGTFQRSERFIDSKTLDFNLVGRESYMG
jgi:hypothetical protein